ncbi:integrator complex subunit 4-like [Clavelina lepadiformis]|uniref:integrator complex subunit 4-like n=1 Tax=Clavelina lepadiformis TaxID=159417 RepID=UPI004042D97E
MAVHLKKRAYEEFGHVIQEAPKLKLRKLRISKPSSSEPATLSAVSEDIQLDLEGQPSHVVLQILLKFSKQLPVSADHAQQICDILLKHFHSEKNTAVRAKIAWLLRRLSSTLGFHPLQTADKIIILMDAEVSGKVLAQLWSAALSIALRLTQEKSLHQKLVTMACSGLTDHHQEVRCCCLNVIGNLATNKNTSKLPSEKRWDQVNVHTLVADYFADPEPRVRSASLRALILMHQRGQRLELNVYEQSCAALNDDHEVVRLTAVELVWILSHVYPESLVKAPCSDEKIRLVDDAFAKICNLFNDSSYKVRAEAARLLGSMHLVSDSFLFQTLDKKLMSDLRRKKSLNEQAKEGFVEEFSSGAKWADDAVPREQNPDTTTLMNSGACGAFVHGLEDEMMEVRTAAVDSLTELASQRSNSSFAQAALDFLVDCLNDEIEAVRLNAVNSLHMIVEHVTLLEDQLDNVHSAMEDSSGDIRAGIHQLLSSCRLMSKSCLYDTVMMLLKNLNKYPQDRHSVWKTQQRLGKHHSELVYLLVPQLLSCHPFFDTSEPEMDDPSYISILILVFNAAESCPQMIQLFPEHVLRHYQYLRDSIPELVPQDIQLTTNTSGVDFCIQSPPHQSDSNNDPASFLQQTLARVRDLKSHETSTQRILLERTIHDLRHTVEIAPSLSSTAQCSADFLQAQLLLLKAVDKKSWSGSAQICCQHIAFAKPAADQIIQLTLELEHLYLGLSDEEVAMIRQLRIKAQALLFVLQLQELTAGKQSQPQQDNARLTSLCKKFFRMVEGLQIFLNDRSLTPDSFARTLFNELLKLSPQKHSLIIKFLQPLLSHYSASEVDFNNKVQRSSVVVQQPQPRFDAPITFSAGLAACVHVEATLLNVVNPVSEIRIRVMYPDMSCQLFELHSYDVKQLSPFRHQIKSKIYLSHTQWSDSCVIKLSFVKIHNKLVVLQNCQKESATNHENGQLQLCKPVSLTIHPKPAIRV